ncbi:MAG: general secretion pathway protein GspK [Candidatus Omnitrophica bacterium]|nr:general secretion pathway protein GspK [Candidatus Omnitrophota bacterium]
MRRNGFFIIFFLWVFILLSIFCFGLGFRTYLEVKKTKLLLNRSRAYFLASSGVRLASVILDKDDTDIDALFDNWAGLVEKKVIFMHPKNEGKILLRIEDESARVNINKMDSTIIGKLFKYLEINDWEVKANCVLDYIDSNNQADQLNSFDSDKDVKNSSISVPEELMMVKNFSSEDYKKIKDYITVFTPDNKININTAKKEVLEVLLDSDKKEDVFGVRFNENSQKKFYTGDMILPDSQMFKVSSNVFRVTIDAEVDEIKKKVTCIIKRDSNEILYWNEE